MSNMTAIEKAIEALELDVIRFESFGLAFESIGNLKERDRAVRCMQDIREALAALEAEKTAGNLSDAIIVAKQMAMKSWQDFGDDARLIQQYAEAYHEKACAECKKLKAALSSNTRDRDAEIDGIAEKE